MVRSRSPAVVFIDDDEISTAAMVAALERRTDQIEMHFATTPEQGIEITKAQQPEVVVVDLSFSTTGPASGLDLIRKLAVIDDTLRILVLTGHTADIFGIQAIEAGASSFLKKPIAIETLFQLIIDGITFTGLKRKHRAARSENSEWKPFAKYKTQSLRMKQVLDGAAFAATNHQPLLITGETGTGKGVIARAIHEHGTQRRGPFVHYTPGVADRDLTSSELFGHTKGAFTGALEPRRGLIEEANRGTLFLDEVDEIPSASQVSLLHTLQDQTFRRLGSSREHRSHFRLVCATNRSIRDCLSSGKLRHDFYHRIGHFVIELPPLRERKEDILQLAEECLTSLTTIEGLPKITISRNGIEALLSYNWPGNLRELNATINGAAHFACYGGRSIIEASDLFSLTQAKRHRMKRIGSFREQVATFELELITEALHRNSNNQSKAARELKLDRSTMRRILERKGHTQ